MKTHAMWAIATLSVAALTALLSRRDEKSAAPDPGLQRLEEKNAALRERVARLEAEIAGKALPPSAPESADPRPGKAPEPLRELPKVVGIEQIRALFKSGTREDLNKAFKEIEALPDRAEKLALLRDLLAGGDRQQGLRSVSILKKMGGADAAQLIAGVLTKDGPSDLRAQAAVALGELGDQSALPALQEAWRTGDVQVRSGVAVALDRFGQREPLESILGTLSGMLGAADGGTREDAMDILTGIKMPGSLPLMVAALGDPSNNHLREDAADAMGAQGLTAALPYLEKALQDPSANVRTAAERAIARIKPAK